jgi:hypothetical protein|tara:strand:- start:289 stop:495 length:207 start_codon:yes stop_codon:yes gene_type:complete
MTFKVTATIKIEHEENMTERLNIDTTVWDCNDIKQAFSKVYDKLHAMTESLKPFGNVSFKITKVEDLH